MNTKSSHDNYGNVAMTSGLIRYLSYQNLSAPNPTKTQDVSSLKDRTNDEDRLRSQEEIDQEVEKIRTAIGDIPFLSLGPTERAQAIVKHRSFISKRVNERLWDIPIQEVVKKNKKHNTLFMNNFK